MAHPGTVIPVVRKWLPSLFAFLGCKCIRRQEYLRKKEKLMEKWRKRKDCGYWDWNRRTCNRKKELYMDECLADCDPETTSQKCINWSAKKVAKATGMAVPYATVEIVNALKDISCVSTCRYIWDTHRKELECDISCAAPKNRRRLREELARLRNNLTEKLKLCEVFPDAS